MPVNPQKISPVSGSTSGAGIATTVNTVVERVNGLSILANTNESSIGDLTKLNSDDKSNIVVAFNNLVSRIESGDLIADYVGLLRNLNTSNKVNVVAAVNEVNNNVGPIQILETAEKKNVVAAINYLNTIVGQLSEIGDGDFTNIIDALNSKVAKSGDEMSGPLGFNRAGIGGSIFSGEGDASSQTANSLSIMTTTGLGFKTTKPNQAIPTTEYSHFFNVATGDYTARGNVTVGGLADIAKELRLRGDLISFRNSAGNQKSSITSLANGHVEVVTVSASGKKFVFTSDHLSLPADPVSPSDASNKNYIDKKNADTVTFTENTYMKKIGGEFRGVVYFSEPIHIAKTISVNSQNDAGYDIKTSSEANGVMRARYMSSGNMASIRNYKPNGTSFVKMDLEIDGNVNVAPETAPTKPGHLIYKSIFDSAINSAKERSNHTGTQPVSTITGLGDLAVKNRVAISDLDVTGTANSQTILFGDGSWKSVNMAESMKPGMYDPRGIQADAFSMLNMTEASNKLIMTSAERTKLAGIEAGATKTPTLARVATTGLASDLTGKLKDALFENMQYGGNSNPFVWINGRTDRNFDTGGAFGVLSDNIFRYRVNGTNVFTISPNGQVVANGQIRATSGTDTGVLTTNGDVQGSAWKRWNPNGDGWAQSAINAQIESRAYWRSEEYIKDRTAFSVGSYCLCDVRYGGGVGANGIVDGDRLRSTVLDNDGFNGGRGTVLSGTWRCMGTWANHDAACIFLRIA